MIRGLYTSAWSMKANNKKMDVISNNLANVNTTAFKKDTVVFESFPDLLAVRVNDTRSRLNPSGRVGTLELGSDVGEVYTYFNQGQLVKTDNYFDLAISNSSTAFFTVQVIDENGQAREFYTRDGAFTTDHEGFLATKDGHRVLGLNGPILIGEGKFSVEGDGTIIKDNEVAGRLLIRDFTDTTTLRKYGNNLLARTDETQERAFEGTIMQGHLEQSNVNIIKEMVDMITVIRSYEANQKIIQAHDSTLGKAVNEVGSTR